MMTRNETGSRAALSRSGKVLFTAACERIVTTEQSWPRGCQQSAGGTEALQTHAGSLPPGRVCVQPIYPKFCPQALSPGRGWSQQQSEPWAWGSRRLTTGSISGTLSPLLVARRVFRTARQPGSAFAGSFSVWVAASSRASPAATTLTQGHQSRC